MAETEMSASTKLSGGSPTHQGEASNDMGVGSGLNYTNIEPDNNNASAAAGEKREMHENKIGKQSFASLFKDNRSPVHESLLKFIEPLNGEVIIGGEEIESVEKTFGFCLVGYVMGPRPNAFTMINFLKRWDGNVKFVFKENGWIKFQFSSELQRDAVLNGGPYLISGRQLFLKVMPSCFLYSKEDMMFLPSWIQIFGLPQDCWTAPALSKIASVVGKPIHTDQLTITKKGLTYARVLVEIDAKKPRVWEYSVKLPTGKTTVVRFKYEMDPKFCGKCNSLGHTTEFCGVEGRKKNTTQHRRQHENTNGAASTVDVHNVNVNVKQSTAEHLDTPECSQNHESMNPVPATNVHQAKSYAEAITAGGKTLNNTALPVDEQHQKHHATDRTDEWIDPGKGTATVPLDGKQPVDDFGGDDLLSGDDTDSSVHREYDMFSDKDDPDNILSRVRTQDQDEWKKVIKKNRRYKKNMKNAPPCSNQGGGASSTDTEFVPLDPDSKLPWNKGNSRVFGKSKDEARRPYTAFGGQ